MMPNVHVQRQAVESTRGDQLHLPHSEIPHDALDTWCTVFHSASHCKCYLAEIACLYIVCRCTIKIELVWTNIEQCWQHFLMRTVHVHVHVFTHQNTISCVANYIARKRRNEENPDLTNHTCVHIYTITHDRYMYIPCMCTPVHCA